MGPLPATQPHAGIMLGKSRAPSSSGSPEKIVPSNGKGNMQSWNGGGGEGHGEFAVPVRAAPPSPIVPLEPQSAVTLPAAAISTGPATARLTPEGLLVDTPEAGDAQTVGLLSPGSADTLTDVVAYKLEVAGFADHLPELTVPGEVSMVRPSEGLPLQAALVFAQAPTTQVTPEQALPTPGTSRQVEPLHFGPVQAADGRLRPALSPLATGELATSEKDNSLMGARSVASKMEAALVRSGANSDVVTNLQESVPGHGQNKNSRRPVGEGRIHSDLGGRVEVHGPMRSGMTPDTKSPMAGEFNFETKQSNRVDIKVTVLHQETHFGSSSLQDPYISAPPHRRSEVSMQPTRLHVDPANLSSGSAGPMKVLHLHLEPAKLGGVVVRMSLKGEALTVQIQPQLQQTAVMLRGDVAALNTILQAAGVLPENANVQISDPAGSSSQPDDSNWSTDQNAGRSGSTLRDDADAGGSHAGGANNEYENATPGKQDEQDNDVIPGGSSELYL